MKRTMKKLLSILLILALVISLMPALMLSAAAADTVVSVGGQTAEPGSTVTVPVTITGNPGFATFIFTPSYDTANLTLTSVSKGSLLTSPTGDLMYYTNIVYANGVDTTGDGVILNLQFTVGASAAGTYPISLALWQGDPGNFCNSTPAAVPVIFQAGGITVNAPTPPPAATPIFSADLSTAPVTYTVGQTASPLTVAASVTDGGTVTYQWYSNTMNSTAGGTPVGTGDTYVPSTAAAGTTYYYVIATNTLGESSATAASSIAAVTVTAAASGTAGLQSVDFASAGTSGVPYTLQPQFDGNTSAYTVIVPDTLTGFYMKPALSADAAAAGKTIKVVTPVGTSGTTMSLANNDAWKSLSLSLGQGATSTTFWIYVGSGATGNPTEPDYYQTVDTRYTFTVLRSLSLSGLTANETLKPAFNKDTLIYAASVPENDTSVSITATAPFSGYSLTVAGTSAVSGTASVLTLTWDANGQMTVPITVSNDAAGAVPTTYTLTLNKEMPSDTPQFSLQPQGATYFDSVANAVPLTVKAYASGTLTYQWYSNTDNSATGGTLLDGATAASYTPPITSAGTQTFTTYYYCVVTNTQSGASAASNTAAITIRPDPTPFNLSITLENGDPFPAEGYTLNVGADAATLPSLKINAQTRYDGTDGTFTYQWWRRKASATGGSGMGTAQVIKPYVTADGEYYYYCTVTYVIGSQKYPSSGIKSGEAGPVKVVATSAPAPVITKQAAPDLGTHLVGTNNLYYLMITASNAITYQWYHCSDKDKNGAEPISGATSGKYMPDKTQAGTFYYFCRVTNTIDSVSGDTYSSSTDTDVSQVTFITSSDLTRDTGWSGSGTADSPYMLEDTGDLAALRGFVHAGYTFYGTYFKLANDATLPVDWVPIGIYRNDGNTSSFSSKTPTAAEPLNNGTAYENRPFSATLDGGGHTVTVPENGLPLFGFVREATVKNISIYGSRIAGYGLINAYSVDYGRDGAANTADDMAFTATLDNITIKAGTQTLKAGLVGGYASGIDFIYIKNCVAEQGITVGYDKAQRDIGSFGGSINGTLEKCVSYADVYGTTTVGGLVGGKNQSMGPMSVSDSAFHGTVTATGDYAGGIIGKGYASASAPNSPCVSVKNCCVSGSITGNDFIGGVFGGEAAITQCWANGAGYITNNIFYGTVSAAAVNPTVGGIVGFMKSLDRYNIIENNYYLSTSAQTGIGRVEAIDYTTASYGRSVNPFVDNDVCTATTLAEFASGRIAALLNGGSNSTGLWTQTGAYPALGTAATATHKVALTVTGSGSATLTALTTANDTAYQNAGSTVTVSAAAGDGHQLTSITVTSADGTTQSITSTGVFVMPQQDAAVTVEFTEGSASAETPAFDTNLSSAALYYPVGIAADALTVAASVTNTGTVAYQWYSGTDNATFSPIDGAQSAAYTPSTAAAGTTYYYVVATNTAGGSAATATSVTATVTVSPVTTEQVKLTAQDDGAFLFAPQTVTVSSDQAEQYGYRDSVAGISALDVLVKAHALKLGASFTLVSAPDYLAVSAAGSITRSFGVSTMSVGFAVNGIAPNDGVYVPAYQGNTGYTIRQAAVHTDDLVEFYFYEDDYWMDQYAWFSQGGAITDGITTTAGQATALTLEGYYIGFYGCNYTALAAAAAAKGAPIEDVQLALVNTETGARTDIAGAVTDEDGNVSVTFPAAGTYLLTAYMPQEAIEEYFASPVILPLATVTVSGAANTAPTIKEGVTTPAGATVSPGEAYTLDLATIFEDADSDPLTYTVAVDGADPVSADASYSYTPAAEGVTALVFTANDGTADSAAYTVSLTAARTTTLTFRVGPSTDSVTFYATTGYDANGVDQYDANAPLTATDGGVVSNYHVYTVKVPVTVTTISFRGTDASGNSLGGMTVDVDDAVGGVITLTQVELYVATSIGGSYPTAEQVIASVKDADNKTATHGSTYVSGGLTRFRFLLFAGGNAELYSYYAIPQGALAQSYGTYVSLNATVTAATSTASVRLTVPLLYAYTITAPTGATVQIFNQIRNFYAVRIDEVGSTDNGDGTTAHAYQLPGSNSSLSYRVSMSGKITKAGWLPALTATGSKTVTWTDGDPAPTTRTNNVVASVAPYVEENVLLNVNSQNFLELNQGGTFRLRAYRGWQIVNNITANIMIEPDFHYNVISGSGVVSVTPVTNGNGNATCNWLDITALNPGTAIIEITYDAITVDGATYNGTYAASDPNRSGLLVVHVGANGSGISLGMSNTFTGQYKSGSSVTPVSNTTSWDAEYDTVYFYGNSGTFSFSPVAAGSMSVEVLNAPAAGGSWTTLSPDEGVYTATILPGNNIIRITSGDTVEYQIVRGAPVTTTITNVSRPGQPVRPGDSVSISFNGLYMPLPKFSGIYNPGFGLGELVVYGGTPENVTLVSTVTGNQYSLRSKNGLTVSAASAGTYTLSGGFIYFNVMGIADPLGGHRLLTDSGVGANFSAVSTLHTRALLPDVTITVYSNGAVTPTITGNTASGTLNLTSADVTAGAPFAVTATTGSGDVTRLELTFTAETLAALSGASSAVIHTDFGDVTLDAAAIANLIASAGGNSVTLTVEKKTVSALPAAQQGAAANADVILELSLTSGGSTIAFNNGTSGTVTVEVPFTPSTPDLDVTVYYIDEAGSRTAMTSTCADGQVTFTTTHLSLYTIEETHSDYSVGLTTASADKNVGETITAGLNVTGAATFAALQTVISYDKTKVSYKGNTLTGYTVKDNAAAGTITITHVGTPVSTGLLGNLTFTVKSDISMGSASAVFSVASAKAGVSGSTSDLAEAAKGADITVAVHNLTVTFAAGSNVTMAPATATAYVKYGQAGLYAANDYAADFAYPTPSANTGYTLDTPVWTDGTGRASFATIAGTAFTASAAYTATATQDVYTITYMLDGGTNSASNPASYSYGDSFTLAEPTKAGATFGGWFKDGGFTQPVSGVGATDTGNKTFYVRWLGEVAVTLPSQATVVSGVTGGKANYGTDIVFTVAADTGSTLVSVSYTAGSGTSVALTATGGQYTIPGTALTDDVTVTVTQRVTGSVTFITFDDYMGAPTGFKVLLLTAAAPEGYKYRYDGADLFWSEEYEKYACFVPVGLDAGAALTAMTCIAGTAPVIKYDGNVNQSPSGLIDIVDAQLVYDLYTGVYLADGAFGRVSAKMRLAADVNGDGTVDTSDVQIIINLIHGIA